MNNIKQKNTIMRLNENIGLPYLYPGHAEYETGTNISQANLNNTFVQLVDNDLYIENKLANDYGYSIGPKPYSETAVENADNGYKMWGSMNSYELSILQKKELSIQESLSKIFPTKCYFAVKYDSQFYVGTDDGLVFSDNMQGTWRMLQHGVCRNYWLDEGSNTILFAFNDGIYHLRVGNDGQKKILKITSGQHDCHAVFFRAVDCLMLASSGRKLSYAYYSRFYASFESFDDNYQSVELKQCDIYDSSNIDIVDVGKTNAFASVESGAFPYKNSVFIGTDSCIAQLSSSNDFTEYAVLPDISAEYTSIVQFNGKVFAGTTAGMYMYDPDENALSPTQLSSEEHDFNVTCVKVHGGAMYACANGRLYKNSTGLPYGFQHCKLEFGNVELSGVNTVAFAGDGNAYMLVVEDIVEDDGTYVYYSFGDAYSELKLLPGLECNEVYSICTSNTDKRHTVGIAYAAAGGATALCQYVLSKIVYDEDKALDKAELVKIGESPALVSSNSTNVIKSMQPDGHQRCIATQYALFDADDFQTSCAFYDDEGHLAAIHDIKYIDGKSSYMVLFSDSMQLSAVNADIGQPIDSSFYYVSEIVSAMSQQGLEGAYDYQETDGYSFLVTKQTSAPESADCDGNESGYSTVAGKYFIAYSDNGAVGSVGGTGKPCMGFFHSPVSLDEPTTLAGQFDSPPKLMLKDGKVVVFDESRNCLNGYFEAQPQLVQQASQFFSIVSDYSLYDVQLSDAQIYGKYIFTCGTVNLPGPSRPYVNGLFMNQVSSMQQIGSGRYMPLYSSVQQAYRHQSLSESCKQVLSCSERTTKIYKTAIAGKDDIHAADDLYICTSKGLYKTPLSYISALDLQTIDVSTVGDGPESFHKTIAGDVKDAAAARDLVVAAAADGLSARNYQERYCSAGQPSTLQQSADVFMTAPYGEYLDEDQSSYLSCCVQVACGASGMNYSVDMFDQDGSLTSSAAATVPDMSSRRVASMVFCSRYMYQEPENQIDKDNDFIAALNIDNATGNECISIVKFSTSGSYAYQQIAAYAPGQGIAIANAEYTLSSGEDYMTDARLIIASSSNGGLSSFYDNGNSQIVCSSLADATSGSSIVAVGSMSEAVSEHNAATEFQYTFQISKTHCYQNKWSISKSGSGYQYSKVSSSSFQLPDELSSSSAVWSKYVVQNGVLYALIGNVLYAVDLQSEECISADGIQDMHIGCQQLIVQKGTGSSATFETIVAAYQSDDQDEESSSALLAQFQFMEDEIDFYQLPESVAYAWKWDNIVQVSNASQSSTSTYFYSLQNVEVVEQISNMQNFTDVLYCNSYQSYTNGYNVYAMRNSSQIFAYSIDEYTLDVLSADEIYNSAPNSIKQLFMHDGKICFIEESSNSSEVKALMYSQADGTFSATSIIDLETTLVDKAQQLTMDIVLSKISDQSMQSQYGSCNVANAVLGVVNNYDGMYFIANEHLEMVYVMQKAGTYIEYTSLSDEQDNSNIYAALCNKQTDGKLLLAKISNGLEWLELKDDMHIGAASQDGTAVQQFANYMLSSISISSIDKIICNSDTACFIKYREDGSDAHSWMYTCNGLSAQPFEPDWTRSDISWIDSKLQDIELNDVYESAGDVVYCTTDGLWKSKYSRRYQLQDGYQLYSMPQTLIDYYDCAEIQLSWLEWYSQYQFLAKLVAADGICKLFGVIYGDDGNGSKELKFSSMQITGDLPSAEYQQILAVQNSDAAILYVQQDGNDLKLHKKYKNSDQTIYDHRNAAAIVSSACKAFAVGDIVYVLASADDSFRFESFKLGKLSFMKLGSSSIENARFAMFMPVSKSEYAIAYEDNSNSNIALFDFADPDRHQLLCTKPADQPTTCACKLVPDDSVLPTAYYFPGGAALSSTQQLANSTYWQTVLSVDSVSAITGLHADTAKSILIATDAGLYCTKPVYTLQNDIRKLTPNDVLDMFYSNLSTIDNTYEQTIADHISRRHALGSVLTRINNEIMDVKFSNIAQDWTKYDLDASSRGETITYNDLLHDIKFGEVKLSEDKIDETIYANTSNSVQSAANVDLNYVMKRWMSGYTELYINLPTTGTYYLNHVLGTPNCTTNPNELIDRKNLSQLSTLRADQKKLDSSMERNCTHITVGLQMAEYHIDELLDVQIHGNSLPLKIYRDNIEQHYDNVSSRLYQSYIMPSVIERADVSNTANGYYIFEFACFGTDAQAIRIAFNDHVSRYGSNYFTIEFNSNKGAGSLQSQKIPINEEVELKHNTAIYKDSSAFLGWSLKATVDGMSDPMLLDGAKVSKQILESLAPNIKILPGSVVTLFAVWEGYELLDNDSYTTMTVKCTDGNLAITPVFSNTFVDNVKPISSLVVDFGD